MNNNEKLVITGTRADGSRLRPSDWAERLSSVVAEFGPDHRLHYSASVYPAVIDGQTCLVVEPELRSSAPQLYDYIMRFAERNRMTVRALPDTEAGREWQEAIA